MLARPRKRQRPGDGADGRERPAGSPCWSELPAELGTAVLGFLEHRAWFALRRVSRGGLFGHVLHADWPRDLQLPCLPGAETRRWLGEQQCRLSPATVDYSYAGSGDVAACLASFPATSHLRVVSLAERWSYNTPAHLAGLRGLRTLEFAYCSGLRFLAPLGQLTQLRVLRFRFCGHLGQLPFLGTLPALHTLDLTGSYSRTLEHTLALPGLRLRHLYLPATHRCLLPSAEGGTPTASPYAALAGPLARLRGLRTLHHDRWAGVPPAALQYLHRLPALQDLCLSYRAKTTADVQRLLAYLNHDARHLRRLDVTDVNGALDAGAARALGPAAFRLHSAGLAQLVLTNCNLRELGLLSGLTGLQRLSLRGAHYVRGLGSLPEGLAQLFLSDCLCLAAGEVETLARRPALRRLTLVRCEVDLDWPVLHDSSAGLRALALRAHPGRARNLARLAGACPGLADLDLRGSEGALDLQDLQDLRRQRPRLRLRLADTGGSARGGQ